MENQFFFRSIKVAHKVEVEQKAKGNKRKPKGSLIEDYFSNFFVFIDFFAHPLPPDGDDSDSEFERSFDLCSLTILHSEF